MGVLDNGGGGKGGGAGVIRLDLNAGMSPVVRVGDIQGEGLGAVDGGGLEGPAVQHHDGRSPALGPSPGHEGGHIGRWGSGGIFGGMLHSMKITAGRRFLLTKTADENNG